VKKILEWRQTRAKQIADARAMLDKAEDEKRDLTGEESVQYNALLSQAEKLQAQIEREERQQQMEGSIAASQQPAASAHIGMNQREVQKYSLVRAIWASVQNDWRGAELEREASVAVARQLRREPQGFFVPADWAQRDLVVGTNTAGGHTVQTELLAQSFITLLRNSMMVRAAGATILSDLTGNIAIPRQTGGATAYWVAENGAPTESQQAFDQVTMTPKTVGAFTDMSRRLLMQSSLDVEAFVRGDLATVLGLAIDLASMHGSGSSNQPLGIAGTSGIGSVAGGTNGLAPAWSHLVSLETEVAIDNADINRLAYVTNAKVRGKLKQVEKATNTGLFLWADGAQPINGYPAYISNQVSSTLTKGTSSGVCSAIFFGNWADLIIGLWGGLDILVDPYTGSTAGTVRVVALQDVDIAVRHPESFAAMLDALTT
jgi:HK97 family phage major capsid protein